MIIITEKDYRKAYFRILSQSIPEAEKDLITRFLLHKMNPSDAGFKNSYMKLFDRRGATVPKDINITGELFLRKYVC